MNLYLLDIKLPSLNVAVSHLSHFFILQFESAIDLHAFLFYLPVGLRRMRRKAPFTFMREPVKAVFFCSSHRKVNLGNWHGTIYDGSIDDRV